MPMVKYTKTRTFIDPDTGCEKKVVETRRYPRSQSKFLRNQPHGTKYFRKHRRTQYADEMFADGGPVQVIEEACPKKGHAPVSRRDSLAPKAAPKPAPVIRRRLF